MINGNRHPRAIGHSIDSHPTRLRAEMARLTLLLRRVFAASAQPDGKLGPSEEFAGLYVSEDEVRQSLEEDGLGFDRSEECPPGESASNRTAAFRLEMERTLDVPPQHEETDRLSQLADRFHLTETEIQILSTCLAPEVDIKFHRFFAYLQNDVNKKRPCIQFLARLCDGLRDVVEARALLSPDAPLIRHRLLGLSLRGPAQDTPIPLQQPIVASTVVDYLFGRDRVDERLISFSRLVEPRPLPSFGAYTRHHQSALGLLGRCSPTGGSSPLSYIAGPPGSLRGRLVEQLALNAGKRVLRVRAIGLLSSSEGPEEDLALLSRDATLHGALIHLEDLDAALTEENRTRACSAALEAWLATKPAGMVVLTGSRSPAELGGLLGVPVRGFSIPHPSIEERSEIWSTLLQGPQGEQSRRLIDDLASKFRFTPGQIQGAVRAAVSSQDRAPESVGIEDLHRSCREASNQRLLAYAKRIAPRYGWEDIALPVETSSQLREVSGLMRHRRVVYGRWGFESKFSVGNGVAVLFAGPSGTGKTMSAEIIAKDLELDLYKLDLSSVVSKYVGETERNLDRIFDEAETSNSILFFDEADALFGKRSEVKDAHDRYANIEINYLLQKLDDYVGFIILATNFKGNIDAAFTRRLNYIVDFPAPDAELRRQIWAKVFPPGVPIATEVDFEFLARKFELSGGNIKNIALNSAFLAAGEESQVRMAHVIRATRREYQKLGRLCSKSEFGPYLNLARNEPEP